MAVSCFVFVRTVTGVGPGVAVAVGAGVGRGVGATVGEISGEVVASGSDVGAAAGCELSHATARSANAANPPTNIAFIAAIFTRLRLYQCGVVRKPPL
jgi:hypothetical protein